MKKAEFKVKKRWWIWALFILCNFVAISICFRAGKGSGYIHDPGFTSGSVILFTIILIVDLIIIPDASHFRYVLNDKFLEIKCILYPGADILLSSIIAVENAALMTFRGAGVKIYEESFGAIKIVYTEGRGKHKSVIITPKNRTKFIEELGKRVDPNVILIDNKESAFKKKKDNI